MRQKKIFVFGSNLAGRHTKGAALTAYQKHGAIYGQGMGLQNESYGIPTRDEDIKLLSLNKIKTFVDNFIKFAKLNPDMRFEVSRVGCDLGGYEDKDIALLFKEAPDNCVLPVGWRVLSMHNQPTEV